MFLTKTWSVDSPTCSAGAPWNKSLSCVAHEDVSIYIYTVYTHMMYILAFKQQKNTQLIHFLIPPVISLVGRKKTDYLSTFTKRNMPSESESIFQLIRKVTIGRRILLVRMLTLILSTFFQLKSVRIQVSMWIPKLSEVRDPSAMWLYLWVRVRIHMCSSPHFPNIRYFFSVELVSQSSIVVSNYHLVLDNSRPRPRWEPIHMGPRSSSNTTVQGIYNKSLFCCFLGILIQPQWFRMKTSCWQGRLPTVMSPRISGT